MIPRLILVILKWPTCCTNSFLIQTVTNIPTICLLATRLNFIWVVLEGVEMPVISKLLDPSSSSSEEKSSSLTVTLFDCWQGKQNSLLYFLSSSSSGVQLHIFSLLLLSVRKLLLIFLREGFWKKSELLKDGADLILLEDTLCDLFNDLLINVNHLPAGSLSSITSTLPAFNGTISWKLKNPNDN